MWPGDTLLNGMHHVCFLVEDMDQAVALFSGAFGLSASRRFVNQRTKSDLCIYHLGKGGSFLELIRPGQESESGRNLPPGEMVFDHAAFGVSDLDGKLAELQERGLTATTPRPTVYSTDWRGVVTKAHQTLGVGLQLVDEEHQG